MKCATSGIYLVSRREQNLRSVIFKNRLVATNRRIATALYGSGPVKFLGCLRFVTHESVYLSDLVKDTYLDQSSVDKMFFLMIDKNSENNWDESLLL